MLSISLTPSQYAAIKQTTGSSQDAAGISVFSFINSRYSKDKEPLEKNDIAAVFKSRMEDVFFLSFINESVFQIINAS